MKTICSINKKYYEVKIKQDDWAEFFKYFQWLKLDVTFDFLNDQDYRSSIDDGFLTGQQIGNEKNFWEVVNYEPNRGTELYFPVVFEYLKNLQISF